MKPYPHRYVAEASGSPDEMVELRAEGLPAITSAPPAEFDGPGDQWSPETLLVAAVADSFLLTFRAIAQASRFSWQSLDCRVEGTLDRVERTTRFTGLTLHAQLRVEDAARADQGRRLLEKAERGCLITNSLAVPVDLKLVVS